MSYTGLGPLRLQPYWATSESLAGGRALGCTAVRPHCTAQRWVADRGTYCAAPSGSSVSLWLRRAALNSTVAESDQLGGAQRSTAQHSTVASGKTAAHAVAGSGWPILRYAALQVACGELHTLALADDSEVNTSIQPRRNPSIGCAPQCSQHSVLLSAAPARAIDYREHRR